MAAFQFNVTIDGNNLLMQGLVYNASTNTNSAPLAAPYYLLTPIGLLTNGLVFGKSDFWSYNDNVNTITWTLSDQ